MDCLMEASGGGNAKETVLDQAHPYKMSPEEVDTFCCIRNFTFEFATDIMAYENHEKPGVVLSTHFFWCWASDCQTSDCDISLPGLPAHPDPLNVFPGVCWGYAAGKYQC